MFWIRLRRVLIRTVLAMAAVYGISALVSVLFPFSWLSAASALGLVLLVVSAFSFMQGGPTLLGTNNLGTHPHPAQAVQTLEAERSMREGRDPAEFVTENATVRSSVSGVAWALAGILTLLIDYVLS